MKRSNHSRPRVLLLTGLLVAAWAPACSPATPAANTADAGVALDAARDSATDAASTDSGSVDAGSGDASALDGAFDAALSDASSVDSGTDGGPPPSWVFPTDPCGAAFFAAGSDHASPTPSATLAPILAACPAIRARITWQTATGTLLPYDSWSVDQMARLEDLYAALVRGDEDLEIACPDTNARTFFAAPDRPRATYLSAAEAFDVFAAHVAHAFYLEASRSVDWSLVQMLPAELDEILSSDRYQTTIPVLPSDAYAMGYGWWNGIVMAGVDYQLTPRTFAAPSIVCDPRDGFRFLNGENSTSGTSLIQGTARETLESMTLWLSENIYHGDCTGPDCLVPEYKFSLRDRLLRSELHDRITAPLGCHSAQNLMFDLARSANIPLRAGSMRQTLNDMSYFFYMTHGSLVYDFARAEPRIFQHLDDAYAMELFPAILPRTGAGALTRAEVAHQAFEAMWSTEATLAAFNFEVIDGFPLVIPGDIYAGMSGLYDEFPHYGPIIGAWMPLAGHEPLDSTPGVEGAHYPAGMHMYKLHQAMQVCGARLISDYCAFESSGVGAFTTQMNSMYPGTTFAEGYGIVVTGAALWDRAAECVEAVGGCAAATTLRSELEASYGNNTWTDPSP